MNVHADSSVEAEDAEVTGYINNEETNSEYFTKGDSVTMKVKVSGVDSSKVTYQWLNSDDENISGETGSELTIKKGIGYESYYCKINIDGADWGYSFYLYASNTLSTTSSTSIDGEECSLYSDKIQREGIKKGTKVELKVSAESDYEESKLTYQWQKAVTKEYEYEDGQYTYTDYENIENATAATYTFTKGTEEKESYVCEISDGNTIQKEYFDLPGKSTLTVTQKIGDEGYTDTEPSGEGEIQNFYSTTAGTKLKLAVDVESSAQDPEFSYTWYGYDEDGYSSEIATEPSCTVTKKTNQYDTDHGEETYWCEVSDGTTTLTYYFYLSLNSTLTVNDKKIILGNKEYGSNQKLPNDIAKGTSATLSVSAETTHNNVKWTYQWQKGVTKEDEDGYEDIDYEDITGATSEDYSFTTSGVEENYRCITSDGNETRYPEFTIPGKNTISATQEIAGEEYSSTKVDKEGWKDENYYPVQKGNTAKLTVKATSSLEDASLSYEWYDDSMEEILESDTSEDGTSSSCEITKRDGQETYRCEVSDGKRRNIYYFYLEPENTLTIDLKATIDGKVYSSDDTILDLYDIPVGTSVALSASAKSTYKDGALTYQWQRYEDDWEDIEEATDGTYSFNASSIYKEYRCIISDGNESTECSIWIYVADTITATQEIDEATYSSSDEDKEFYPSIKGDKIKLTVKAESSVKDAKLSYEWYYRSMDDDDDDDEPEESFDVNTSADGKSSSCTITKGSNHEEYSCTVSDGSTTSSYYFYLESKDTLTVTQKIDNEKYSSVKVDEEGYAEENIYYPSANDASLTLSVETESSFKNASLSYTWYDADGDQTTDFTTSADGKSSSYKITKKDSYEEYSCKVSDGNRTNTYYFYLEPTRTITATKKINDTVFTDDWHPAWKGTNLKFSVEAETSLENTKLSYTWYNEDDKISDVTTSADGKSSYCEITKGDGEEYYRCEVSDGNRTNTYYFNLELPNTLTSSQLINGNSCESLIGEGWSYPVPKGKEFTLSVNAETTLEGVTPSYTWYDADRNEIKDNITTSADGKSSSYKMTKGEDDYELYFCEVTDGNETVSYDFRLSIGEECNHNFVTDEAVAPTCTKAGKTEGKHCSICGYVETAQTIIPKNGHTSDAGTITKAATETTTGIKTYKCTVCGTVLKEETIPATGTTDPTTQTKGDTGAATTAQSKTNTAKANTAKAAAATVLKNGTQVTDQKTKAVLKVTSKNTVTYVKSSNKKAASVTIPTSITKNGTKYTVTAIAPKAFYKNKKLKKVVIPKTVKKIGKQAFFGCKNLKKITIKTTSLKKKSVGAKAFKGIHKKATIKVPKKQKKAYKKILKARGIAKTVKVK